LSKNFPLLLDKVKGSLIMGIGCLFLRGKVAKEYTFPHLASDVCTSKKLRTFLLVVSPRSFGLDGGDTRWKNVIFVAFSAQFFAFSAQHFLCSVCPLKGKEVCICRVEFSFGGGQEDLLCRIFMWSSGVVDHRFSLVCREILSNFHLGECIFNLFFIKKNHRLNFHLGE
jgi:hypothetical protein